jgi:Sigma-70, region 4
MSPLEPLAPDQRAVVSLVLQQGRSYDDIAALLGIPVDAVRARAHAGLASLARDNGLPHEVAGPLADFLLGQQAPADAAATRGLLGESAPARAWASNVAAQLEDVAPRGLPEIPHGSDTPAAGDTSPGAAAAPAPPGPRPRPVREAPAHDAPPPASRIGGALLIAGVLAVIAVVLVLVLGSGGDDSGDEQAAAGPRSTPTPTATAPPPAVADTIPLRSTTGQKAKGRMTIYIQDQQLLFALEAQDVPQSRQGSAYAVWFTGPGDKARRLGFTNPVGADGRLGIQGPSDNDLDAFPKLYATHTRVVVSEETSETATTPTRVLLSGTLPKGR